MRIQDKSSFLRVWLMITAACLILAHESRAAEPPQIGGVLNIVAAETALYVNGVPVTSFAVEEGGSGGTSLHLTGWLINGSNQIRLTVKPVTESARAKLELQDFGSGDMLLTLEQEGAGEQTGTVTTEGLPEWSFERATPRAEQADGLAAAVAELHKAYAAADMDRIVEVSNPAFVDQGLLGGMDAKIFREEAAFLFEVGKLAELPELTVTSHLDGKLFRVTGPDGDPPIAFTFEQDGMKGAMRTGEWWSVIDGDWRVVR